MALGPSFSYLRSTTSKKRSVHVLSSAPHPVYDQAGRPRQGGGDAGRVAALRRPGEPVPGLAGPHVVRPRSSRAALATVRLGQVGLACRVAKQARGMCRSARHVRLPDLLMERDELAATERSDAKILKRYARYELLVIDEWLTEDVDDVAIRFLLELVERRYMDRSTVLCTQYSPADWHGRLGGGVQADAMVDRLVHGAVRIDLGDVNVRKLLSQKKATA